MNFDKINLRPDSGNGFSAHSQDTESGQVDFGPFCVDISPTPADTHLSQVGGVSTEADQDNYTFRFENVDTFSSDEAVSHLKATPALIANTGKVVEKNGKFPVEFINEITDLLKKNHTLTEFSELIKYKNSLMLLLKPQEAKDEDNISCNEYVDLKDIVIKGVPITSDLDLKEHLLKPDTEPEVETVYSFYNGDSDTSDWQDTRIAFGILKSGDSFQFQYFFNVSRQSFDLDSPDLIIAPDWKILIDNLADDDLKTFVTNMSKSNSALLHDWLNPLPTVSLTDTREKLKIVLNPDLLDKFCQQVINN
ncbi:MULTISPECIES: hypothetical protein [unclassified Endozoicomonas]|uniref:hypothetical protein n=1 Tax=unclassified Endozoicomonas TaxID=2644528 RepID=UPI003BB65F60